MRAALSVVVLTGVPGAALSPHSFLVRNAPDDGGASPGTTTEQPRIGKDPVEVKNYHDALGGLGGALYAIGCARKWDHGQAMDEATTATAKKSAEQAHAEELAAPDKSAAEFKKECMDSAVKRRQECPKFYCRGTMANCEKTCGAKYDALERDCQTESNSLLKILADKNRVSTDKGRCVAEKCSSVGARLLLEAAKQNFDKQCREETVAQVLDANGDGGLDAAELAKIGVEGGEDPVPRLDFNKNGKVDYDEIPASAAKTIFKDIGVCVLAKKTEWASGGAVDKLCADPDAAKHGDICKQECADPAGFMGCVGAAEVTGGGTMFDWCMGQYQNWVVREQVDWKTGQPKAR